MRRALGLRDEPAGEHSSRNVPQAERRPRRFVRDGEVPVVVVKGHHGHEGEAHGAQERLKAAEAALHAEREAREALDRRLQEARTQLQSLQTKLAHAELTHGETLAAERQAREAAERALQEALAGRSQAEGALAELTSIRQPPAEVTPRRRGRPPAASRPEKAERVKPEPEPEPIKWWLPGYRKG